MRRCGRAALVILSLLVACATARSQQDGSVETAAEIYAEGERAFAAGRADQAVQLWRHALQQLPSTPDQDALRHKLILRTAYGQLVAHDQTGDRRFLEDGRRMLNDHARYLEASGAESSSRADVRELLAKLDEQIAASPEREASAREAWTGASDDIDMRAENDPNVRAWLEGSYSRSQARSSVLPVAKHEEKWLVRLGGSVAPAADGTPRDVARIQGRAVLYEARAALRECLAAAAGRTGKTDASARVRFTVGTGGQVSDVKVLEGGLMDALGNVCLIESLQRTSIGSAPAVAHVSVPLVFYRQREDELDPVEPPRGRPDPLE